MVRRRDARARATSDEDEEEDEEEDASTTPRRARGADASDPARARAEGDAYVQDKLERELRLRGKIYRGRTRIGREKGRDRGHGGDE